MRAIDRWLALSPHQRRTTIGVMPTVVAAVLRVRILGVKRALAWADVPLPTAPDSPSGDIVSAVARAARYVPRASCLPRSIALARLLRKRGVAATVRIGVHTDPDFAAHAWVEVEGRPLRGLRDDLDLELRGYVAVDLHRHR